MWLMHSASPQLQDTRDILLQCGSTCRITSLSLATHHQRRNPQVQREVEARSITSSFLGNQDADLVLESSSNSTEASSVNVINNASVLHPRVAVLLGIDSRYHKPLLLCRLLSIAPALWWCLKVVLAVAKATILLEDQSELRNSTSWWDVELTLAVPWVCRILQCRSSILTTVQESLLMKT